MMLVLGGANTTLAVALREYQAAWKAFQVVHHLEALEHAARPATISWKVADKAALFANLQALGAQAEQTHIGTVNGRFISSSVLHEAHEGMRIIKILERRRGSADPLGLDSLDFLVRSTDETYALLKAAGAHVEQEHNDMHEWLSLRFGKNSEYEAKFTDHIVLDVAIREMQQSLDELMKLYSL